MRERYSSGSPHLGFPAADDYTPKHTHFSQFAVPASDSATGLNGC